MTSSNPVQTELDQLFLKDLPLKQSDLKRVILLLRADREAFLRDGQTRNKASRKVSPKKPSPFTQSELEAIEL